MKVRNFERRVRAGLEEKPLPKATRLEAEAPKRREPRIERVTVEEPTLYSEPTRRGPGNGTIGFLALSVMVMSLYLAMGGPRLIWPDAKASLIALSDTAGAPHAAKSSSHRVRVQKRFARALSSIPSGYVGPADDFAPADADLNDTVMVRSIGAWNSASGSMGHWMDDEGLSTVHVGFNLTMGLAQKAVAGLFDTLPSSNPTVGMNFNAPMIAGTGAFIAVLIMCFGIGAWLTVRASHDERKQVFRFDGYYQ